MDVGMTHAELDVYKDVGEEVHDRVDEVEEFYFVACADHCADACAWLCFQLVPRLGPRCWMALVVCACAFLLMRLALLSAVPLARLSERLMFLPHPNRVRMRVRQGAGCK